MSWISKAIEEGQSVIEKGDRREMKSYLDKTTDRMKQEGILRPKNGLKTYKQRIATYGPMGSYATPPANDTETENDIRIVIQRLQDWEERLLDPMSRISPSQVEINNINQNNVNVDAINHSKSDASVSVSLADIRRAVDSLDDLTDDERIVLKGLLADIEDADDNSLGEKIMRAVKFVGGKTFEVGKTVLPPIVQRILGE